MATRPVLHIAVAKTKSKASEYNDNFDMMMQFVDDSIQESKDYVDGFMPDVTGQSGKFLTNNGTTTSWFDIFAANNTFSGTTTFSGDVTISGGTFDFPKCTTTPTTTSTASNTLPAVVVLNYKNGSSWYRVWSDNFCEQGGYKTITSGANTVNLLKNFADTNYSPLVTIYESSTSGNYYATYIKSKTTSSFSVYSAQSSSDGVFWRASGYIA